MKQLLLLLTSIWFLLAMSSCDSSEMVEGVDAGGIFIENSTNNELNVSSDGSLNVEYKITPRENTSVEEYGKVTFLSSDTGVFEVDDNGVITGKRNGTARLIITASSEEHEVKGSCVVRVTGQVFVENIQLDESVANIRINIYESAEFQILEEHYAVFPANALIRDITFASSNPLVASVDQDGLITGLSGGTTVISILSTDGSGVKADITVTVLAPVFTWYLEERRNFVFDYREGLLKYPLIADGSYGNDWKFIIDEGSNWQASFISFAKPGRAMAPGAVVGDIFIPIDMQQELKFNQIFIRHRSTNTLARLRIWEFDLLGSDDGVNFHTLAEKVEIPGATVDSQNIEATILFDEVFTARYIKIVPTSWHTSLGNTMQVSDLKIGYDESRDPDFGE